MSENQELKKAKEVTGTRNEQSEKDRKRIERNKRERVLSKQRGEVRDEENKLMLSQIERLQDANDALRVQIDDVLQELSTLLSREQVQKIKEILSIESEENKLVTEKIFQLQFINKDLESRIERLSEELSKMMPRDQIKSILGRLTFEHSALKQKKRMNKTAQGN